jgi:hypothetical protein
MTMARLPKATADWTQVLEPFRAGELPELGLLLLDNREALRAAVAWPLVQRRGGKPVAGADWAKLWHGVDPDLRAWAGMAGIERAALPRIFAALRDAHIIYPDGTTAKVVGRLARLTLARETTTGKRQ